MATNVNIMSNRLIDLFAFAFGEETILGPHLLSDWKYVLSETSDGYSNPARVCKAFCAAVEHWITSHPDLHNASAAYARECGDVLVPYKMQEGAVTSAFLYKQYRWALHRANVMGMMIRHKCPMSAIEEMTEWTKLTHNREFLMHTESGAHKHNFFTLFDPHYSRAMMIPSDQDSRKECYKWLVMLMHHIERGVRYDYEEHTPRSRLHVSVFGVMLCMNALLSGNKTLDVKDLARTVVTMLKGAHAEFRNTIRRCKLRGVRIRDDEKLSILSQLEIGIKTIADLQEGKYVYTI